MHKIILFFFLLYLVGDYSFAQSNRLNIRYSNKNGKLSLPQKRELLQRNKHLSNPGAGKAGFEKKRYTGRSISLNFQNIQVRSVLQLLAEFTGMDLVVSDLSPIVKLPGQAATPALFRSRA